MVTFLILMRIERVDGASAYLTKNRQLVLKQLGYNHSHIEMEDAACASSDIAEWEQDRVTT